MMQKGNRTSLVQILSYLATVLKFNFCCMLYIVKARYRTTFYSIDFSAVKSERRNFSTDIISSAMVGQT